MQQATGDGQRAYGGAGGPVVRSDNAKNSEGSCWVLDSFHPVGPVFPVAKTPVRGPMFLAGRLARTRGKRPGKLMAVGSGARRFPPELPFIGAMA